MPQLSDAGQQLVNTLAQKHGLSQDAVTHMLVAIQNGNGSMAQFSHPEFGGSGQWMRGGMTMVSDLFNNQLKYRVDSICNDLADQLANHQIQPYAASFQSQSQNGNAPQNQTFGGGMSSNNLFQPDPRTNWWPQDLGSPSATGSQNQMAYAYFPNSQRLAVKTGSDVWVYDTLNHHIGGFSQQQGADGSITLSSQFGTVSLATLPVVMRNGVSVQPQSHTLSTNNTPTSNSPATASTPSSSIPAPQDVGSVNNAPPTNRHEILSALEQLGSLRDKGYLTDQEFNTKKAELLSRL